MDQIFGAGAGIFGFLAILFIIILTILWTILPFAIFGIKPKLDKMGAELEMLNGQLEALLRMAEFQNRDKA